MVLKQNIQKKRVKDLEPGDRVRINSLELEVAGIRGGQFYFYGQHPQNDEWKRVNGLRLSIKSQQWVELIENSKRIEG